MKFEELQKQVLEWADKKDLLHEENAEKQFMKFIEEVIGLDFSLLSEEEIFAYVQGMKTMYEMERESWRYFEDDEEGEEI